MSFSDDDLKRLKEIVETDIKKYPLEVSPYVRLDVAHLIRDSIPALLARLEAAERLLSAYDTKEQEEAFDAWEKSKSSERV